MGDEKRKGECESCGKRPRVIRPIESGYWVCRVCRGEIRPKKSRDSLATDRQIEYGRILGIEIARETPRDVASRLIDEHVPAAPRQIDYARRLGFDVEEGMPEVKVSELLDKHKSMKWYVYDVWTAMTGKRPTDSYFPHDDMTRFVTELIVLHGIYEAIDEIEMRRFDEAFDVSQQHQLMGREVEFRECFSPVERDATYRSVAALLRQRFLSYLPLSCFLSRLSGS